MAYQDVDKVKELAEAGANIDYQDETYGSTALISACRYNLVDVARYLIEKGAGLKCQGSWRKHTFIAG